MVALSDNPPPTIIKFMFQGRRNLSASRYVSGIGVEAELEESLRSVLPLYKLPVRKVELVTYQHGRWVYDEWPAGLTRVLEYYDEVGTPGAADEESEEN